MADRDGDARRIAAIRWHDSLGGAAKERADAMFWSMLGQQSPAVRQILGHSNSTVHEAVRGDGLQGRVCRNVLAMARDACDAQSATIRGQMEFMSAATKHPQRGHEPFGEAPED